MKRIIAMYFLVLSGYCSAQKDLPGLIAYYGHGSNILKIYKGKNIIKEIDINPNYVQGKSTIKYSSHLWLNKQDGFVCQKSIYSYNKKNNDEKDLVIVTIDGKFSEMLYDAQEDEFASNFAISPNDSKIVFSVCKRDPTIIPITDWPISIHVIDRKTKDTLRVLNDFCLNYNFDIEEKCWSPDENKFVYSLTDWKNAKVIGEKTSTPKRPHGIYIYDILKNEHIQISSIGEEAIWSPNDDNTIAYIANDDRVLFFNLATMQDSIFYPAKERAKLSSIHWTPDGQYMLITGYSWKRNPEKTKAWERLIKVSTGEIVKHNKIGFAFRYFSWRMKDLDAQ